MARFIEGFWRFVKKYWWASLLILVLKVGVSYGWGYRNGYYDGIHKSDELREQMSKSLVDYQKENEQLREKNLKPAPTPVY